MAGVLFPDFARAIGGGMALRQQQQQADMMDEERAAKKAAGALVPQALGGDKEALGKISTLHPDTAMKLAPLLERLDASQRTKAKEAAEYITSTGMAILSAPPDQQAGLYARVRAEAAAQGRNVSTWPTQYDPGWVKFNVDKAMTVAEFGKRNGEGVQYVDAGGGGRAPVSNTAPGGSVIDRSAGATASLESGNRYDVIGPVANSKGNRAYGKYQVMDFNIGPWTKEVLGQAMTPQQFLASPQAQDAVYKAKMGQYIQKHGSPEAAARAWFAGEGGMNNPGAKDVLGTTVQAYGDKFAQAYGPGATGGATPPGMAMGDAQPRADASGNPLPPGDAIPIESFKGVQLPPGYKIGTQGGKIFSPVPGYVQVMPPGGGAPVLWPVPKVKEPGAAPSGYQFSPEGGLAPIPGGPADPARQRADRVPPGYRLGPDGQSLEFIPGGPADPAIAKKAAPMTEGQANAALYADRMRAAEKVILANQAEGQSAVGKALEILPGGNYLQGEGYQLYEQARRDFINAVLRRESGAVISDQEFANAEKQYFPRPGDKPDVLKQKAENRRIALEGISRAAGSSYKPTAEGAPPAAASPMPAPAPVQATQQQPAPQMPRAGADRGKLLFDARDAIAKGADPAKVRERLKAMGVEDEP